MKSKEELNALKERIETLSKELRALSDEELEYVTGGVGVTNEKLYMGNIWFNITTLDITQDFPINSSSIVRID